MCVCVCFFFPFAVIESIQGIDVCLKDEEKYTIGSLEFQCFATPGHTIGHCVYWFPGGWVCMFMNKSVGLDSHRNPLCKRRPYSFLFPLPRLGFRVRRRHSIRHGLRAPLRRQRRGHVRIAQQAEKAAGHLQSVLRARIHIGWSRSLFVEFVCMDKSMPSQAKPESGRLID